MPHKNPVRSNLTLLGKETDELGIEAQVAIDEIAKRSKLEIQRLMVSVRNRVAIERAKSETAFDGESKAA